jgi:hypothetical protein
MFVGMFMIVHGIYEEKYDKLKKKVQVKYKFIPRTYYDDFLMNTDDMSKTKSALFDQKPDSRSAGFPIR